MNQALSNSHALIHLILVTTLQGRCHHSPRCTEGEKNQRLKESEKLS